MLIDCKKGVWIKFIDDVFLVVVRTLSDIGNEENFTPCITSAAERENELHCLHRQGWAWDIGTRNMRKPFDIALKIQNRLAANDPRFQVVYGTHGHFDLIHIEFDMRKGT